MDAGFVEYARQNAGFVEYVRQNVGFVEYAGQNGGFVEYAGQNGGFVEYAGQNAGFVEYVGQNGGFVEYAGHNGGFHHIEENISSTAVDNAERTATMVQTLMSIFFVLCALVSAYNAYATSPAASYCVDLTTGKTSVLPGNTPNVMWTKKPSSNGGRCKLQGVLRITPPRWARSVSFHMAFERSTSYSFNIGDSSTNNGWGGDSGTTRCDAEIHSYRDYLKVFRSDVGGSTLLKSQRFAVKTAMLIRLSKNQMYAANYEGFNYYIQDRGLFAFDTMYMGLNRVVSSIYGSTYRTGRGLCSVCIYFLKETVYDIHRPFYGPRVLKDDFRRGLRPGARSLFLVLTVVLIFSLVHVVNATPFRRNINVEPDRNVINPRLVVVNFTDPTLYPLSTALPMASPQPRTHAVITAAMVTPLALLAGIIIGAITYQYLSQRQPEERLDMRNDHSLDQQHIV
ncbi:hypothetical protein LSAT2_014727 [Lamellibrachia satsuma]|nr:hypothetical protein LSAT2_014727 [Lamellibrachia satsuma]